MQFVERFLLLSVALAAAGVSIAPGALARPASAAWSVPPAPWLVEAAACGASGMPGETYRAYVKGAQEELTRHGYDAGPPDGTLGSRTETAIRRYQRDAGLPVDGCASKELLDHLKFHLPRSMRGERRRRRPSGSRYSRSLPGAAIISAPSTAKWDRTLKARRVPSKGTPGLR